jgi:squalene-hopene/tetraprenyl-beta-curcumene cyclase
MAPWLLLLFQQESWGLPFQAEEGSMKRILLCMGAIVVLGVAGLVLWAVFRVRTSSAHADGPSRSTWSPAAAASYLDYREAWWQGWKPAQLEKGTVCISCHTVVPYAFVRPELRLRLGEAELTTYETKMLSSIETRVDEWAHMKPYYTDAAHAMPSHSTEAVLNAVILAAYGAGNKQFDPVVRRAFDNAWALQETTGENAGAWEWQNFHEAPWESSESGYQGATMMAIGVGIIGGQSSNDNATRDHVGRLRDYLVRKYATQPPMNQLYVLWASAGMSGLLSDVQRKDLIQKIADLQNADGGWSLSSLDRQEALKPAVFGMFKHADQVDGSDGCATGLAVLAMKKAGISSSYPPLQHGLEWLRTHQSEKGSWWASSMNGFRDPASEMGHFMSDAATGYAVLALEDAEDQARKPDSMHNGDAAHIGASATLQHETQVSKHVSLQPM